MVMQQKRNARFESATAELPLIAILRGLEPKDSEQVTQVLYRAGFRLIEVPLNSPEPFEIITRIRQCLPHDALVGAGTVLTLADIARLAAIDADLTVMPHADADLIRAAKQAGMICLPGVLTPTEAFSALQAGADGLKLFPAELVSPAVVKALRAVLPKSIRLFPVGSITSKNMPPYLAAGANGFGLGSALYSPGISLEDLAKQAECFVSAWKMQRHA